MHARERFSALPPSFKFLVLVFPYFVLGTKQRLYVKKNGSMSKQMALCQKIWLYVKKNGSTSKQMALCQNKWLYVKTNGSKHEPILVTQTLTSRACLVCGNYLFTHNMFSLELPVTKPKRTVAISWHVSSSKISTPSTLNPKPSTLNPQP